MTRSQTAVAICAILWLAALVLLPWIGSASVSWNNVRAGLSPDSEIFWQARLPRVLLSIIAGGALSVAGVLFQALLRDSLADPYTLGISSGASLGAVLAICFGGSAEGALPLVWLAALGGAALALLLVLALASHGRRISSFSLLMAGVTVNTIAIAVILLLQNVATFAQTFAINRWLMGSIESVPMPVLAALTVIVSGVFLYLWRGARGWNLLAAGEDWAAARGLETVRWIWSGFLAGSLVTGSVTVITGPVGFLGLIVPHALRLWLGADHRVLLPCALLLGGAFLAVSDTMARTVLAPVDVPVGVLTAMLGGPRILAAVARPPAEVLVVIVLVGGGSRSGKTRFALELARGGTSTRLAYVATAELLDGEMRARAAAHRAERAGLGFDTVEEPRAVAEWIEAHGADYSAVVLDCLTLWTSNWMLAGAASLQPLARDLAAAAAQSPARVICVTNEVGCGIVPDTELGRRFRDEAGWVNQIFAAQATEVYWMVFGCPFKVKG